MAAEVVERESALEPFRGHGASQRLLDEIEPVAGADPVRVSDRSPALVGIAADDDDAITALGAGEGQGAPHTVGAAADDDDAGSGPSLAWAWTGFFRWVLMVCTGIIDNRYRSRKEAVSCPVRTSLFLPW